MRPLVKRKPLVDRLLAHAANVLTTLHGTVYFPTFSNGFRYLGCHWSAEGSSGLQSIVWRARWERDGLAAWKDRLHAYNAEDCSALRTVADFLQALAAGAQQRGTDAEATIASRTVAWADAIQSPSNYRAWQKPTFVLDDMEHLNRCAYFDYQRDKVFVRTSPTIRRCVRRQKKPARQERLRVNKEMAIEARQCPYCNADRLARLATTGHSKIVYDLRFAAGSVRRHVLRCSASRYRCEMCDRTFLPTEYKRLDKYQHGLKSWVIYQYLVHRSSLTRISDMLMECFGLRMRPQDVFMVKCLMAKRYDEAYKRILERIIRGGVILSDETHANLRKQKVYVWMLANLEDVYYMCRRSRETAFLLDLLRPFSGVFVSDFYPGYDALPCEQQKCLVHLIRDINDDLKCNPYDVGIDQGFGDRRRREAVRLDEHRFPGCLQLADDRLGTATLRGEVDLDGRKLLGVGGLQQEA
jgi:transposase-like protein